MNYKVKYCRDPEHDSPLRVLGTQGTVVVDLPSREFLLKVLESSENLLETLVGISILNPKESFCKELGKKVAWDRMAPTVFRMEDIEYYSSLPGRLQFRFVTENPIIVNKQEYEVTLHIATYADSASSRLLHADIVRIWE